MDLFDHALERDKPGAPLAERMRPSTLAEVVGQAHLLDEGKVLRRAIENDRLYSMILWGPPGSGKTTLARVIAARTGSEFIMLSAVMGGVKEVRSIVAAARDRLKFNRHRTVLFIDEIHRFNKVQQDALLPHVENGTVTLIGATTENPSFEVNAALLSRARVFRLNPLQPEDIRPLLERALDAVASEVAVTPEAFDALAEGSWGDARRALNALEAAIQHAEDMGVAVVDAELAAEAAARRVLLYDRAGDEHYNVISAFIKALRGSDPDGAIYWMMRMLEAGEEPRFVARRLVIFASEDVGNADPRALQVAVDAFRALEFVGLPEAALSLTQAAAYLACAPKSNAMLKALGAARRAVREYGPLPVPDRHRNASTNLMKAHGYGKGYRYPHEFSGNYAPDDHLPPELADLVIYDPSGNGDEAALAEKVAEWRRARADARKEPSDE